MTQPTACVICVRRQPRAGMVCDPDRDRLGRVLTEIVELYALLPAQLMPGQATGPRVSGSREAPLPLRVDPLDLTMPARAGGVSDGLVPQYETVTVEVQAYLPVDPGTRSLTDNSGGSCDWGECNGEAVAERFSFQLGEWLPVCQRHVGPRVRNYPTRALTLRQRQAKLDVYGQPVLGPSGDQDGYLSVAAVLDSWVQDWRGRLDVGDINPVPTVPELARWLSTWANVACDDHPEIDECANELFTLAATLRRINGLAEVKPDLLDAECPRCDRRAMYRLPGEDRVECACGRLMTEDEYRRYVGLVVADLRKDAA